jgi:predicted secreted hydrolase
MVHLNVCRDDACRSVDANLPELDGIVHHLSALSLQYRASGDDRFKTGRRYIVYWNVSH